jgi:hypothetical protein
VEKLRSALRETKELLSNARDDSARKVKLLLSMKQSAAAEASALEQCREEARNAEDNVKRYYIRIIHE